MSDNLSEKEKECLSSMKDKFPDSKDMTLLRFIRGRNCDLEAAMDMHEKYLNWRNQFPNPITLEGTDTELQSGIWYFHGKSKDGYPCVIIKSARFYPDQCKKENLSKMVIYAMEQIMEHSPEEKVIAIVDYNGFGYANVSYDTIKWLIQIYSDYYPEILHAEFVINAPWLFSQLWNWNKRFLDERTTNKIHILPGNKEEYITTLLDYFDKKNLPKWCGGESTFSHRFRDASSDNPCIGEIIDRNEIIDDGQGYDSDEDIEKRKFVMPKMQPDDDITECNKCKIEFGWFKRKHHCRACGLIYCSKCCNTMVKLPPEYKLSDLQRVCIHCANEFE